MRTLFTISALTCLILTGCPEAKEATEVDDKKTDAKEDDAKADDAKADEKGDAKKEDEKKAE